MDALCTPSQSSLHDRVAGLLTRIEYQLVRSESDWSAVHRLRYKAYLREGAIAPSPSATLTDEFDGKKDVWTAALRLDKCIVATIRIHVLRQGSEDSPTFRAFSDLLQPLLAAGQILIDPTRFAVDAKVARRFPELPYITLRLPFLAAGHFGAQTVLAAVRPEHMPFYRRVLRFSPIAAPRSYPQLSKLLGLMLVDYPRNAPAVVRQYPFFRCSPDEGRNFFGEREAD